MPFDRLLLLAVYGCEAALGLGLLGLHRLGDRSLLGPLTSVTRLGLLASALLGLSALTLLLWRLASHPTDRKAQVFTVLLNMITVLAVLFVGEASLRLTSAKHGDLRVFLDTRLLPRDWRDVTERYRNIIRQKMDLGELSYLSYDTLLGWSPAPSRISDDSLYFTSTEGIRSSRPGEPLLHSEPDSGESDPVRIALVGDSYTFGLEVAYEDTWGYQLERLLGSGARVRNFGVPGYGVDQAVLRYERDARPWAPHIVILAPIAHDFARTMSVYIFANHPLWDYPFSKPRLVFQDNDTVLVNIPTMPPQTIFAHTSITELPDIEYDIGYAESDWQFRPFDRSVLVRFFASRFPPLRTAVDSSSESMDVVAVNGAILQRFVDQARAAGTVPILAYLPSVLELGRAPAPPNRPRQLMRHIGTERGVHQTDLTALLRTLEVRRVASRDGEGTHYSAEASRVVAEHLADVVSHLGSDETR